MPSAPPPKPSNANLHHFHSHCFVCGQESAVGLRLIFENQYGIAIAHWQPDLAFQSYPDRVHGGILSALLDAAMVHALHTKGIQGATADLNVRFRHPVEPHHPVEIRGLHESTRRGFHSCRAEIHQEGKLAAEAHARFATIRTP